MRRYIVHQKENATIFSTLSIFIILFVYIFAFFLGPVSSSLILGVVFWIYSLFNRKFLKTCFRVIQTKLILQLFKYWIIIVIFGLFFSIIYCTFDYSLLSIYFTQILHYIAAVPVLAYLTYKKYTASEIEKSFISVFAVQTFIQLIAASIPSLRQAMFAFNHFDPTSVSGMGDNFRGSALAAATTYHLSLAYGIAFIIYVKHYFIKKINSKIIILGIIIFAGIFCAGRSGFVGCIIAIIGYVFIPNKYLKTSKSKAIIKVIILSIVLSIALLSTLAIIAPDFYEMLNTYILPYAFEFIYNQQNGGQMETASTNRLMEMWGEDFNYIELLIGSGHFTNPDGSYYMHVDPGILRHLLFFGIVGYVLIIYYQYLAIPYFRMKNPDKYFCRLIYIFILVMDFKGLTAGGNKFMIFIPLLLAYTYLYLPSKTTLKNENTISHSLPSQ